MFKSPILTLLLLWAVAPRAEETGSRTSVYAHPLMMMMSLGDSDIAFCLPVTLEHRDQEDRTWALKAQFSHGRVRNGDWIEGLRGPSLRLDGLTLIASRRFYKASSGFYVAPAAMGVVDYARGSKAVGGAQWERASVTLLGIGPMFYGGYSWKGARMSFFTDVGLGYLATAQWGSSMNGIPFSAPRGDLNLGIGFNL